MIKVKKENRDLPVEGQEVITRYENPFQVNLKRVLPYLLFLLHLMLSIILIKVRKGKGKCKGKANKELYITLGSSFLISFLLLTCTLNRLQAQEQQYMFKTLSKEDGLANNNVISFLRDSKGFMWIGTISGLSRFDAYSFKTFVNKPADPSSLQQNRINYLAEDYKGKIWISCGIYMDIYDPVTEHITHMDSVFDDKLAYLPETRWQLHKDGFGHYWYRSSKQGLYKYFVAEDSLIKVFDAEDVIAPGEAHRLTGISEDSEGNIWLITTTSDIYKINNKTLYVTDTISLGNKTGSYFQLFADDSDNLWCYDQNQYIKGLYYVDIQTKEVSILNTKSSPIALSSDIVTDLDQDEKGNVWVCTDHGGVNIVNKPENKVTVLRHQIENERSVAENSMICIYKDYEGFIWLGSFKNGANYYHSDLFRFNHYKVNLDNGYRDSRLNDIDNFVEDRKGNLWIGTNGAGLLYYNRQKNSYIQYTHDPENPNSLSADVIIGMHIDKNDQLWVGTYFGGLNKWDGKKFTRYMSDSTNPHSITDDRVWDICEDSDGMLWIATLLGGVNVFNPATGKVVKVFRGLEESLKSYVVFTIIEDREENMWFATVDGVRSYNKQTGEFTYYNHNPEDGTSLSDNHVFDILEDSRGLIWAATNDGLNLLDKTTGKFRVFRKSEGLADNRVLTLVEDNNNNLWASSSNGLSCIQISHSNNSGGYEFSMVNYDEFDGLQGKEFNEKAVYKTSKGELLFGGSNGFNIFHPNEIGQYQQGPNIVITNFYVFNKTYSNKEMLNGRYLFQNAVPYSNGVELKYSENLFTIEFTNLNYFHPERNKYQYTLEGFNKNWLETTSDARKITYTNLDPGSYRFMVQVSNADGTWNPKHSVFNVKIHPVWWQKLWFRILIVLLVSVTIMLLYYLRFKSLNRQKETLKQKVEERTNELVELNTILEERQEEIGLQNEELNYHRNKLEKIVEVQTYDMKKALQKAEESDKLKSAFLANMSHEIRTPMNAIVGFSHLLSEDSISKDERNEFVELIHSNCDALLVIIDDILDVSKIEANQININKHTFDVYKLLDELYNFYKLKSNDRVKIIYEPPKKGDTLVIEQDEVRIKQVLQNLINNAIKFTQQGYVKFGVNKEANILEFFVKDTGIGIPEEDQQNIFKPFAKSENDDAKFYSGAGLGLTICKRISELLKGDLEMQSEQDKGSTFKFIIPFKHGETQDAEAMNIFDENNAQENSLSHHVLVAEDEPANYKLLERILNKQNFTVHWAKDGKEAVDMVHRDPNKYMVVLMDIKMPVMDGIAAANLISNLNSMLPIIAVTAFAYESEKAEILKNDFVGYIVKPIKPGQLLETIVKVTGINLS